MTRLEQRCHTPTPCPDCNSDSPFRPGTVIQGKACGCTIQGWGDLKNPWHIHFCGDHNRHDQLTAVLDGCVEALEAAKAALIQMQNEIDNHLGAHSRQNLVAMMLCEDALEAAKKARES